jgi:chromate transporter
MELVRRTFIRKGALDEVGNAGLVAVSRLTPGTNVLAYCVGLGWHVRRWAGALAALAAASVPASVVICALAMALVRIDQYPVVRMALAVGVLLATLLVFSSAWYLLRPYLNRSVLGHTVIIAVVAEVLVLVGVTPVRILLLSACLGAALGPWARTREGR